MSEQTYQAYDPSANVPTEDQRKQAANQRTPYTGKSAYQKAREAEKTDLIKYIKGKLNDNSSDVDDFVYGLPNAKLVWANVFLKKFFNAESVVNPCDVSLFGTMWMSDKAKDLWEKKFSKAGLAPINVNAQVTARYPTKGGLVPSCSNGVLKTNLKNPAVFNMYTGEMEEYPTYDDMLDEIRQYNRYDQNVDYRTGRVINRNTLQQPVELASSNFSNMSCPLTKNSECSCEKNNERLLNKAEKTIKYIDELHKRVTELQLLHNKTHQLDTMDIPPHMSSLFSNFRKSIIEENKVDFQMLEKVADSLKYLRGIQTSAYLYSICDPFQNRFAKAPSEIPIPSASFSVRTNITLTTNDKGNVAFAFDPYYLNALASTKPSSFGVNNNTALTGLGSSNFFIATDVGQTLPAQLYGKYRLVSAGLKFTVTSSFLNTTGFCTMGLQFDSGAAANTDVATAIGGYANYGQFSLIENSYFRQQAPLRTGEVIQLNYLPLDNTFLQFMSIGQGFKNCTFVGYATGAPANTAIGRLDLVLNYEGTVDLNWTDYIPQAISFESNASVKYLPSVVNYLVDNNKTTAPHDMKDAIANVITDQSKDVLIKPTQQEIGVVKLLDDAKNSLIVGLKDQLQQIINDKKSSEEHKYKASGFLDTLLNIAKHTPLAPVAYGIDFLRNIV